MKDLLSTQDIARHLGVHDQTVRRWIKTGKLRAYRVGQFLKISPEALDDFKKTREFNVEYRPLPEKSELKDTSSLE